MIQQSISALCRFVKPWQSSHSYAIYCTSILNRGMCLPSLHNCMTDGCREQKTKMHNGVDHITVNKHLNLTSSQTRSDVVASGRIVKVWSESPSVKCFEICVEHPAFQFKAGQWVDVFIPEMVTVGGFSIFSAPEELSQNRTIKLGVKKAAWAPANWFHNECEVGSTIDLRVGGNFYLDLTSSGKNSPLLLIAGGVGVNPLAAMMFHASHHKLTAPIYLIFSARSRNELLYKTELEKLSSENFNLQTTFFVTKEPVPSDDSNIIGGRITSSHLKYALDNLCSIEGKKKDESSQYETLNVLMCGPPSMLRDTENNLISLGVAPTSLHYEKWW